MADFMKTELPDQSALFVGASLGGYLLAGLIGKYPDLVAAAAMLSCAQDVSAAGAGMKAKAGLFVMDLLVPHLSQKKLAETVVSQLQKQGHMTSEVIDECFLRPGFYFKNQQEVIQVLKTVNPSETLKSAKNPNLVWFFVGSNDHHDSFDKWSDQLGSKRRFKYQNSGHEFSHNPKIMPEFHSDFKLLLDDYLGTRK
jgi:pimeloyl-ACP methyl ester carboxylesterase